MADAPLNRHGSKIHHQLFDEDTAQIGSIADIVDKHAGDSTFLSPQEKNANDVDGGESDFSAEMNSSDPSEQWESRDDVFPGTEDEDMEGLGETDITGTAPGIARGFGSHLPLDLGADGFEIEEIPDQAVASLGQSAPDGELDDYDDEDFTNGSYDPKELEPLSEPGAGKIPDATDEPSHQRPPVSFDEQLDSSYGR